MTPEQFDLGPGITGHPRVLTRREVRELVIRNARAAGCTCDLHVIVPANYGVYGDVARIRVEHDPGCPVVA
jgi:hypothetical protein